jgi:hypothetical protein
MLLNGRPFGGGHTCFGALVGFGKRNRKRLWEAMVLWREAVNGWATCATARDELISGILETDHEAVLWETSPSLTGQEVFEQVVTAAQNLAHLPADAGAFSAHLGSGVAAFDNLSGDTRLVAPAPPGEFGHLTSFLRNAPADLRHGLWRKVAEEILTWWAEGRGVLWVSTHGAGVPWLHVRLDPRPKYYSSPLRHRRL